MDGRFGNEVMMLRTSSEINEQPDLTLRLSLGGTSKENSLTRSISDEIDKWKIMPKRECSFLSLARSCSLPVDTDQLNLIKLKEFQLIRRFEAKKRLMEQRSGRATVTVDEKLPMKAVVLPSLPSPSDMPAWAAASAAKSTASSCIAIDKIKSIQGSFSQNYLFEGHETVDSRKGSSSSQSSLELNERKPIVTSQTMTSRKACEPLTNAAKRARVSKRLMEGDAAVDMMRSMPNVSTIGDGPNGRKVEGLLYKYKKGEVCIVCVCHGSFLTPAEFVKHAGGREVANPMKRIHVYYTSYSL